ncbi:MAG: hypothetical protein J5I65_04455 [Aridibacter famidurans]|nr:hypothetical protein [Aridibacter famidurans]
MSLAKKLETIREGAAERIPESVREKMERATEELRESGLVDQALKKGDLMPSFELPNVAGEVVRSEELLRPEGLVISFYRGVW